MNTTSAHPANASAASAASAAPAKTVLIWDAPVRVFHWLMVACFAGAYITSESETWRLVHVTLGYTMAGLVAFRVVWGVLGTRHARFSSFVRGPKAVANYLRTLISRRPEHHTGHNPAGALAIVGLLGLTAAIALTGWATYNDMTGEWVAELHEVMANGMLLLVGLHIAAVVVSSWLHKENLARAMLTGRKQGRADEGIRRAWRTVAALMLVAVLGFWWLQWQDAPDAASPPSLSDSTVAGQAADPRRHQDND